jgi:hypothetical protein
MKRFSSKIALLDVLLINMAAVARPLHVTRIEAQPSEILSITRHRKFSPSRGICIYIKRHFNRQNGKDKKKNALQPTPLQLFTGTLQYLPKQIKKEKRNKLTNVHTAWEYLVCLLQIASRQHQNQFPLIFSKASRPEGESGMNTV